MLHYGRAFMRKRRGMDKTETQIRPVAKSILEERDCSADSIVGRTGAEHLAIRGRDGDHRSFEIRRFDVVFVVTFEVPAARERPRPWSPTSATICPYLGAIAGPYYSS
jgi:hypothetical protein